MWEALDEGAEVTDVRLEAQCQEEDSHARWIVAVNGAFHVGGELQKVRAIVRMRCHKRGCQAQATVTCYKQLPVSWFRLSTKHKIYL